MAGPCQGQKAIAIAHQPSMIWHIQKGMKHAQQQCSVVFGSVSGKRQLRSAPPAGAPPRRQRGLEHAAGSQGLEESASEARDAMFRLDCRGPLDRSAANSNSGLSSDLIRSNPGSDAGAGCGLTGPVEMASMSLSWPETGWNDRRDWKLGQKRRRGAEGKLENQRDHIKREPKTRRSAPRAESSIQDWAQARGCAGKDLNEAWSSWSS